MVDKNTFLKFQALGYSRLVPIVPPDAAVSERSSLFRAIGKDNDPRGKTVGIRGQDGKWFGFNWVPYECDAADLSRWQSMGAGVGIKTGDGLVLIDADTKDVERAKIIRDQLSLLVPNTATIARVGNYPKVGYLVRTDKDFTYQRVEFGERDDKGRLQDRVEILAEGRQFVAHGIHPKTKKPYEWPKGVPAFKDLPFISGDLLSAFLETLRHKLPAASAIVREGSTDEPVNQQNLRGELDKVRAAVEATPNTSALFPTREAYRDFGYAIKAALPDNQHEAFELYQDWCDRWQDGDNDADVVASDWKRMKAPFRRGASWLYELAEQHGSFSQAQVWFDVITEEANPFQQVEQKHAEKTDRYQLLTIDEIVNRPPPKWIIERYVPEKGLGFVYSEPGAGKSFITLDIGLTVAYGADSWHGDAISVDPETCVIYIAGEGSFGFRNRITAWRKARGHSENLSKRFLMLEQSVNFMSDEDIKRLLRTLQHVTGNGLRPCLVFVDTVSRALPGADENLQKDMTLFVKACDAIREQFTCAVIGVHHAGKSGDMRGSTVLKGAGDFVFSLTRRKGATIAHLECEKQKEGPDGWTDSYRYDTVALDGEESSLVIERAEAGIGPSVTLTPDVSALVLAAMGKAWNDGEPWSKAPQSKDRYAVKRMVSDFGFDGAAAEETLSVWEASGLICVEMRSAKHRISGFKVVGGLGHPVRNTGIFE